MVLHEMISREDRESGGVRMSYGCVCLLCDVWIFHEPVSGWVSCAYRGLNQEYSTD